MRVLSTIEGEKEGGGGGYLVTSARVGIHPGYMAFDKFPATISSDAYLLVCTVGRCYPLQLAVTCLISEEVAATGYITGWEATFKAHRTLV